MNRINKKWSIPSLTTLSVYAVIETSCSGYGHQSSFFIYLLLYLLSFWQRLVEDRCDSGRPPEEDPEQRADHADEPVSVSNSTGMTTAGASRRARHPAQLAGAGEHWHIGARQGWDDHSDLIKRHTSWYTLHLCKMRTKQGYLSVCPSICLWLYIQDIHPAIIVQAKTFHF